MKLALGTAQFGLPYGVANTRGQIPADEVALILAEARRGGCDTIDTAMVYGDAERVLGDVGIKGWRIVTKLPSVPVGEGDVSAWVTRAVSESLNRMKVSHVHGLLLHRPQEVFGPQGDRLLKALDQLRDAGLVSSLGVSVSSPRELDALLKMFNFALVQAPFNHFDRRLLVSGWMAKLRLLGVELHVRSVFLQGLLLLPPSTRPVAFSRWNALFSARDSWLAARRLDPLAASLGDALAQPEIDRVVVGLDSLDQCRQILAAARPRPVAPPVAFACEDDDLINPARWQISDHA